MENCRENFKKNDRIKFDNIPALVSDCRNKTGIIESICRDQLSIRVIETGRVYIHYIYPNDSKITRINITYNE